MNAAHSEKRSKSSKGNPLLTVILIILAGGIIFSGWKLISILAEYHKSTAEYNLLSESFVFRNDGSSPDAAVPSISEPFTPLVPDHFVAPLDNDQDKIFQEIDLKCEFAVDFTGMWKQSTDVVAWITSPGTVIDYPVLHGATNETYLYANLNGEYRVSGSIFVHTRNTGYLTDFNTIVYGHNMKNGSMFHSIKSYSSQSYYEEHPYIWYVTPQANYVLYVVAGYVASTTDDVYGIADSPEKVRELLGHALYWSDFEPDYVLCGLDADTIIENANRMVVLSTCSYEFNDARYVLVTVPLLAQ